MTIKKHAKSRQQMNKGAHSSKFLNMYNQSSKSILRTGSYIPIPDITSETTLTTTVQLFRPLCSLQHRKSRYVATIGRRKRGRPFDRVCYWHSELIGILSVFTLRPKYLQFDIANVEVKSQVPSLTHRVEKNRELTVCPGRWW